MTTFKGAFDTRFADIAPTTYDEKARTVEVVISCGSPVTRFYGTECLRIHSDSIILDRIKSSGIPLLDSHQQVGIDNHLGRITETWLSRDSGKKALLGRISFNDTPRGKQAEGMVKRGEIAGISAGYRVDEWEIADGEGRIIDPEVERLRWDDALTFTATRWELLEASLVAVPADADAHVRSFGYGTGQDRVLPQVDQLMRGAVRIIKRFGDSSVTYEYPQVALPAAKKTPDNNKNRGGSARVRMLTRQRMHARMQT